MSIEYPVVKKEYTMDRVRLSDYRLAELQRCSGSWQLRRGINDDRKFHDEKEKSPAKRGFLDQSAC